jgi:hypothetical protein
MAKPTTPLRKAVDYLKDQGVITNDSDLLKVFKLESPGALSAYINGTPSKKGLAAFKEKYGEKVSSFFETDDEKHSTMVAESGAFYITPREHIEMIKQHNRDLKEIILKQLEGMDKKLDGVGTNLTAALAGVAQQSIHFEAASSTALESLARLEKKKPDALKKEADKRVGDKLKEISGHRKNGIMDKTSNS